MEPQYLTIKEIAEQLHLATVTIYRAIDDGRLKAFKFGRGRGGWRVNVDDFRKWVESCTHEQQQRTLFDSNPVMEDTKPE